MKRFLIVTITLLFCTCASYPTQKISSKTKKKKTIDSVISNTVYIYNHRKPNLSPCLCPSDDITIPSKSTQKNKYFIDNPYQVKSEKPIVINDPNIFEWLIRKNTKKKVKDSLSIL